MKLRHIEINRRFVPKWMGNDTLPANEQIVIHFSRIPGTSEKPNYRSFSMLPGGGVQLTFNDNLLCSALVQRIENLWISEKQIKTGQDLAVAAHSKLSDLFTEIRDYLFPDDEDITEGEA